MVTLSKEAAQTPFEIDQRKTLFPTESPDTPDVGEVALSKIAVPEIMVQIPFPMDGELAESVATVEQIVWSVPAFAIVGVACTFTDTSSKTSAHAPPGMVQRKMLVPMESPEMLVLARFVLVKFPVPEITLQIPPVAEVAERVVEFAQIVWSVPALAVVGFSSTRIVISSKESVHVPFEIVHLKTLFPTESPETFVLNRFALSKIAVPENIVQRPFPTTGAFPLKELVVAQIV